MGSARSASGFALVATRASSSSIATEVATLSNSGTLTRMQSGEDLGVRQPDPHRVARRGVEVEPKRTARLECDGSAGEGADAELGTLQVGEDADRPSYLLLDRPDRLVAGLMIGMAAVAEVEPEHVGTGLEQGPDSRSIRARRAEGGDDLGVAVASHGHQP